jgi:hypothetical protein
MRKEKTMKVKNLNKSPSDKHGTESWLELWERRSGQNAWICSVQGCIRRPSAGGRVQKDSAVDRSWYVIPLCGPCNSRSGEDLAIWDEARLIPAIDIEAVRIPMAPFRNAARWGCLNIQHM